MTFQAPLGEDRPHSRFEKLAGLGGNHVTIHTWRLRVTCPSLAANPARKNPGREQHTKRDRREISVVLKSKTDSGGWGQSPEGDAPRSEAFALGARRLLPARPQPPFSCQPARDDFEPGRAIGGPFAARPWRTVPTSSLRGEISHEIPVVVARCKSPERKAPQPQQATGVAGGGAGARCEDHSGQQAGDGPIPAFRQRSRRATCVQLLFPVKPARATPTRGKVGLDR